MWDEKGWVGLAKHRPPTPTYPHGIRIDPFEFYEKAHVDFVQ